MLLNEALRVGHLHEAAAPVLPEWLVALIPRPDHHGGACEIKGLAAQAACGVVGRHLHDRIRRMLHLPQSSVYLQDVRLSHPTWWIALRVAQSVLPGTKSLGCVDDLAGLERGHWVALDIERSDTEIWGEISERVKDGMRGMLVVISDASYINSVGPLFIATEDLDRLVAEHVDLFSEPFLNSDAIIICPASGRVAIVHHEGQFGTLDGEPAPAWLYSLNDS